MSEIYTNNSYDIERNAIDYAIICKNKNLSTINSIIGDFNQNKSISTIANTNCVSHKTVGTMYQTYNMIGGGNMIKIADKMCMNTSNTNDYNDYDDYDEQSGGAIKMPFSSKKSKTQPSASSQPSYTSPQNQTPYKQKKTFSEKAALLNQNVNTTTATVTGLGAAAAGLGATFGSLFSKPAQTAAPIQQLPAPVQQLPAPVQQLPTPVQQLPTPVQQLPVQPQVEQLMSQIPPINSNEIIPPVNPVASSNIATPSLNNAVLSDPSVASTEAVRILEEENVKLKSEINVYKDTIEKMKTDSETKYNELKQLYDALSAEKK